MAPYVDQTHECFNHSLTTCKGELASKAMQVRIVDEHGKVLVDETRTTFENGFVGFWLPRDIKGTLRVTYGARVGEVDIVTGVGSYRAAALSSSSLVVASTYSCTHRSMTVAVFSTLVS